MKERVCFIFGTLGSSRIFENGLKKELKYRKEIVVCVFFFSVHRDYTANQRTIFLMTLSGAESMKKMCAAAYNGLAPSAFKYFNKDVSS